jgi:hypothetical protein
MFRKISARTVFLLLLISASWLYGQTGVAMPRIAGESLSGHQVTLPDAANGKVTVLIFGFSRASKESSGAWADRILSDFGAQAGFVLYQLPVIEGAPGILRGMIISSMKKGVPENRRDYFVPLVKGETELKKLVNFKESDDAYLVTLDSSGRVAYLRHGPFRDADYAAMRTEIQAMLNHK